MVRLLIEGKDRVAVRKSKPSYLGKVKNCHANGLCFIDDRGAVIASLSLTPDILKSTWQIIEPEHGPVYFMEAFKAWQEQGKQIICKDKEGTTLDKFFPFCLDDLIEARHILEGHWYIKDYTGRGEGW